MNVMPPCKCCYVIYTNCHKQCKKYREWSFKRNCDFSKRESKYYLYKAVKAEERANRLLKELEALNA